MAKPPHLHLTRRTGCLNFRRSAKTTPQSAAITPSTSNKDEQETSMKTQRRWMKSAIAASTEVQVSLPWARGTRRRPEAMKTAPATPAKPRSLAAR
jgi:hypothetical protein